jgi:hypothetical protein
MEKAGQWQRGDDPAQARVTLEREVAVVEVTLT